MSYLKTVFILHTFKENVNPFDLSVLYDYNRKKQKGYDDMEPYTDNDMTEDVSENDDSDGNGNMGYFYDLNQSLAAFFIQEIAKKNPDVLNLDFLKFLLTK